MTATHTRTSRPTTSSDRKTTYREAMREALREALRTDERVFLMGEGESAGTAAASVSASACWRSSRPNGSAMPRCPSPPSSAPASARPWPACGRSSRS